MTRASQVLLTLGAFAAAFSLVAAPAAAQTIIDQWTSIETPAAPALKEVTVDPSTTALLMLDLVKQTCEHRPRCVASLPDVKKLLAQARAKNLLVVYSTVPNSALADIMPDVAPVSGEPTVQGGVDKFLNTDLEKILKDKGIKTVIVAGVAANGAVLYTSASAISHGFKAIVPVDALSADNAFIEKYVAYNFTTAPVVAGNTTLTRISMIKF
jgi:nicotinamidase-related amidase